MTPSSALVELTGFRHLGGRSWVARLPAAAGRGDHEGAPFGSDLRLFESGRELGPAHSLHDDIKGEGGGRFSHYESSLWFSASDDSDPNTNGRTYVALLSGDASQGTRELRAVFNDALAVSRATSPIERHRLLRRFAALVYPEYSFSDWGRRLDRERDFGREHDRFFREGDLAVVRDRRYALRELARFTLTVPGDFVECGTFSGCSAALLASMLRERGVSKQICLFDSFAGLPSPQSPDGDQWSEGDLAYPLDLVRSNLSCFDNIEYFEGWIPERFSEVSTRQFALVHIDVDLYAPTLASLEFFYPRISPGGLIVCDDYGFESCPGATLAVDEFARAHSLEIVNLPSGGCIIPRLPAVAP